MNEGEKESIEQLKSWREYIIKHKEKVNKANDIEFYLRIVLNLITKLQKENEEKDKQIDLIIEEYEYNDRINFKNFCEDELRKDSCIQDCKLCAKYYFEKLAKEDK